MDDVPRRARLRLSFAAPRKLESIIRRVRKSRSSKSERRPDPRERALPNGTACPVDGCGLPQYRCPSGFFCDNDHGIADEGEPLTNETSFGDLADPPKKPRKQPERPSGEHPSELLASLDMGDLAGLVERVFDVDFDADMRLVETSLKFGDAERADLKLLRRALDEQPDNARIAHRLYCNAREAREVFEIDAKIVESSMREDAVHRLQTEKKSGQRTKAITDADVESMMASLYPDQYRDLARRRKRVEMLCKHLEELAEISKKRINILDTLVNTQR